MSDKKEEKEKPKEDKKSPEEIIKTYQLIEGDYTVAVKLYQAQSLKSTNSSGSCSPIVQIKIKESKKLSKSFDRNTNPIFNQTIVFKLSKQTVEELEDIQITLTVLDKKLLRSDAVIGQFTLDLASVYYSYQHEIFRAWLTLTDPTQQIEGITGYLNATITVLGPHDEMSIHDSENNASSDQTFTPYKIETKKHLLTIDAFRAAEMPKLDFGSSKIDAFVKVLYGGIKIKSEIIVSENPIFNQRLNIATQIPNQSKNIKILMYDKDTVSGHDLVGCKTVDFTTIKDKINNPTQWLVFYGSHQSKKDTPTSDLLNQYGEEMGSHYRGRLFCRIYSKDEPSAKTSKQHIDEKPPNDVPDKLFLLCVDIFQGSELPISDKAYVHVSIAKETVMSKGVKVENGRAIWNQSLKEKKVMLPDDQTPDLDQIPDIIIYLADSEDEEKRYCYLRIKAKDVFCNGPIDEKKFPPKIYKLKEEPCNNLVKDDQFPGFILARIILCSNNMNAAGRVPIQNAKITQKDYQLRVNLYMARNLPPADSTGTSDPFIKVSCSGQTIFSSAKVKTLNPGWFQTLTFDVALQEIDQIVIPSGMLVIAYDLDQDNDNQTKDLLGRLWIDFKQGNPKYTEKIQLPNKQEVSYVYRKPKWYNLIYDATNESSGQILLSYYLIPKQIINILPVNSPIFEKIRPKFTKKSLYIFCLGLRDIDMDHPNIQPKLVKVGFDISGDTNDAVFTDPIRVQNNGININQMKEFKVDLPEDLNFCPIMEITAYDVQFSNESNNKLFGHGYLQLQEIFSRTYESKSVIQYDQEEVVEDPSQIPLNINDQSKQGGKKNQQTHMQVKMIEESNSMDMDVQNLIDNYQPPVQVNQIEIIQQKGGQTGQDQQKIDQKPAEEQKVGQTAMNIQEINQTKSKKSNWITDQAQHFGGKKIIASFHPKLTKQNESKVQEIQKQKQKVEGKEEEKHDVEKKDEEDLNHDEQEGFLAKVLQKSDEIYEEYDTDPEEDLDITPAWLKGRTVLQTDLEKNKDFLPPRKLKKIPLKYGQSRGSVNSFFGLDKKEEPFTTAIMKCIFLEERIEGTQESLQELRKFYEDLMKPKDYICRVYVTKGKNIGGQNQKLDTYLHISLDNIHKNLKSVTLNKNTCDPNYYICEDFSCSLPGNCILRIDIYEDSGLGILGDDQIIAETKVDLEDRFFNKNWLKINFDPNQQVPLERRNLLSPPPFDESGGTQGRLEMWIQLIRKEDIKQYPVISISPPVIQDMELRAIVWDAKDCVYKDPIEKCNDLYIRGGVSGQDFHETDIHLRCRNVGSFNWRWKYPVKYPITTEDDFGGDLFKVQLWDKDIFTRDELIGEAMINLNMHRMIAKAVKRNQAVEIKGKIQGSGDLTNKLWFSVFHTDAVDKDGHPTVQGKVRLSFELMPSDEAKLKENGMGRDSPNVYPVLPEPTGRLKFDLGHPLTLLKELIGPDLYSKCCKILFCLLFTTVLGGFLYVMAPDVAAIVAVG